MEQDVFIGSKFRDLEVMCWDGDRENGAKAYTVICRKCELDPKLHGDATYKVTKHYLNQNKFPCGCGKAPNWSDEQYDIRLNRVVDSSIKYTRIESGGVMAKHSCECSNCGTKWNSNVKRLLDGVGCRKCGNDRKVVSEENRAEHFMSIGVFIEGTKFWTNHEKNNQDRYVWYYTCPKCSIDKYTKVGVCSGVFETTSNALMRGVVSCRCSRSYRKTKQQQIYDILNKCKENSHLFICLEKDKFGYHDKAILECVEHGIFKVDIGGYLTQDRQCPYCRTHGFKKHLPATFYVLEICKDTCKYSGFGITNEPEIRLAAHKRELLKQGYIISRTQIYDIKGDFARSVEGVVKNSVNILNIDVDGFKRECCTDTFEHVCNVVSKELT